MNSGKAVELGLAPARHRPSTVRRPGRRPRERIRPRGQIWLTVSVRTSRRCFQFGFEVLTAIGSQRDGVPQVMRVVDGGLLRRIRLGQQRFAQ